MALAFAFASALAFGRGLALAWNESLFQFHMIYHLFWGPVGIGNTMVRWDLFGCFSFTVFNYHPARQSETETGLKGILYNSGIDRGIGKVIVLLMFSLIPEVGESSCPSG